MSSNSQISIAIRTLLNLRGKTIVELANHLGLTRESVGKKLASKQIWTTDELDETARFLGLKDLFALGRMAQTIIDTDETLSATSTKDGR